MVLRLDAVVRTERLAATKLPQAEAPYGGKRKAVSAACKGGLAPNCESWGMGGKPTVVEASGLAPLRADVDVVFSETNAFE
jgi:hypothetical protein